MVLGDFRGWRFSGVKKVGDETDEEEGFGGGDRGGDRRSGSIASTVQLN